MTLDIQDQVSCTNLLDFCLIHAAVDICLVREDQETRSRQSLTKGCCQRWFWVKGIAVVLPLATGRVIRPYSLQFADDQSRQLPR